MIDTSKKINIVNTYKPVNHFKVEDYRHLLKKDNLMLLRQPRPVSQNNLAAPDNLAASILVLNVFGILPTTKRSNHTSAKR